MAEEKVYRASTGVDEFFYGEIGEGTTAAYIERVKFLQNINVEMPQEIVRAFGDNKTAELAVSSGNISVSSQFHKIPIQDKEKLLGWETVDGLTAAGSEDNPPYVAVVFAKTYEDGSREYVGLPKGMFTRPNVTGQTKGENTEFSSEEIAAQFMDRKVDGFTKEKSVIFAYDKAGQTKNRDALFMKVFGKAYPTETVPEGA
ncbi:major tail protein [Heyndrickxia sporothermodurans]|uniref:major tail protein n=1 Tax=Heyndrickxia sporothermodurans TaxID=46224 RepID=UPI002E2196EB|nr:major tail protein [Heyndrickxia sporothermodurans]MED3650608.1 phage tail protein [Heyndrickxia sporothermodurans]MED3697372.1 phage tail protein [Heyndrickxia sporothermodurans]